MISVFRLFIAFGLIGFGLTLNGYACTCEPISNCTAYSYSKGIYTAKLIRIEKDENPTIQKVDVFFAVAQTYKGRSTDTVRLRFSIGECTPTFQVGEYYLVYEYPTEIQPFCNRTSLISKHKSDLDYLGRFLKANPLLSIRGMILGLSPELNKRVQVRIYTQDKKPKLIGSYRLDSSGSFNAVATQRKNYLVKINLPVRTEIESKDGSLLFTDETKSKRKVKGMTYEYNVSLKNSFCSYREISLMTF